MRTDLPANFSAKLAEQGRAPVQLAELRFAAGTRYVSDCAVGVADGLAQDYEPLVIEWGDLQDTVDAAAVIRGGTLDARQMKITLHNGGASPIAAAFASEAPENVQVYLYQWFRGLAESDKVLIDAFIIQDPITYTEANSQISLDLVSVHMGADRQLGYTLGKAAFPNAEEYGFGVPVLFGQVTRARTFLVDMGLMGTLADETTHNATSIVLNEEVSAWPASGTLSINFEKISYTSRSGATFSGCTRGASSTLAAPHPGGREVFLVGDYYEFGACQGPVASIDKVYKNGVEITTGFTKLASSNPARVRFQDCLPNTHTFGPTVRREMALTSVDSFLNTSGTPDPTVALLNKPGSYITCALGDWQQVSFNNSYLSTAGRLKRVRFKVSMIPLNGPTEYFVSIVNPDGTTWVVKEHDIIPQSTDLVTIVVDFEMDDPAPWSEFLTRQMRCRWWPNTGTTPTTCRVNWMRFEFEYEEKIKVYTRDITLDLTNTSGGIKPDAAISGLLTDMGLGSAIDTASFAAARTKLDGWSYRFNGMLAGDMQALDVLRTMLFQSRTRLVAGSGKLKLVVKETAAAKSSSGAVTKEQLRLRSIEVTRQPVADVRNKLNVRYDMSYSGEAQGSYAGLTTRENSASQSAFGVREETMELSLITSASVAQNLADYYLSEWAAPGSFIAYQVYLPGFAYEKEDKLILSTEWMNFFCVPVILLAASRTFGTANSGMINHYTFITFARPAPVIFAAMADTVAAADAFADVGMQCDITETATVADEIATAQETTDQDGYGQGGYGQGGYGA